jgi:hypothetical protein
VPSGLAGFFLPVSVIARRKNGSRCGQRYVATYILYAEKSDAAWRARFLTGFSGILPYVNACMDVDARMVYLAADAKMRKVARKPLPHL